MLKKIVHILIIVYSFINILYQNIFQVIYQTLFLFLLRLTLFHSYLFHFTSSYLLFYLKSGFTKIFIKKFVVMIIIHPVYCILKLTS